MKRFMHSLMAVREAGYARCFIIYVLIFVAFSAPLCGGSRVISPVRQGQFIGMQAPGTDHQRENEKFSDYVTYAIPEASVFLNGKRSDWIATWMPYNELGRPTSHLSDLSPAYLPNWILSKVTTDAFVYVTLIALLSMFIAGTFAFLLAREMRLLPWPALVAALAVGLSPTLIYWATFPMFACAYGWTAAALYGLARFVRCRDLLAWSVIAFAVYSLMMTAYPVMVVYHAYLAAGFFVYLVLHHPDFPRGGRSIFGLICGLVSALALGILAAAPALLDTFAATLQSARMHPDVDFLRANIQPLRSVVDWSRTLAFWTFPPIFGDPISKTFSPQFIGRSLAPFAVFLICIPSLRRTWGWWLAILALFAADAFPTVFAFAVHYLGLGLSRSVPSVHAIIPLSMIAAVGLDSVLREEGRDLVLCHFHVQRSTLSIAIAATLYLLLITNAVFVAPRLGMNIDHRMLFVFIAYLPLLLLAMRWRLGGAVIALAVIHLLVFDRQLLLLQKRDEIVQSTPITRSLQALLADGDRYAILNSAADFMPPNMNAQMQLSSIHSYDSLSSLRYQSFVRRLGGEVKDYGRNNRTIDASAIGSIDFHIANIGALITRVPLDSTTVVLDSRFGDLLVYRVLDRWGSYIRFDLDSVAFDGASVNLTHPGSVEKQAATIVADQGDRIDLRLMHVYDKPTLLVASKAYLPDWQADGHSVQGWRALRTLPVNEAYEGIVVPPQSDAIRLSYRPWVRWSWLVHGGFGMLALFVACQWLRRRLRRRSKETNAVPE